MIEKQSRCYVYRAASMPTAHTIEAAMTEVPWEVCTKKATVRRASVMWNNVRFSGWLASNSSASCDDLCIHHVSGFGLDKIRTACYLTRKLFKGQREGNASINKTTTTASYSFECTPYPPVRRTRDWLSSLSTCTSIIAGLSAVACSSTRWCHLEVWPCVKH